MEKRDVSEGKVCITNAQLDPLPDPGERSSNTKQNRLHPSTSPRDSHYDGFDPRYKSFSVKQRGFTGEGIGAATKEMQVLLEALISFSWISTRKVTIKE